VIYGSGDFHYLTALWLRRLPRLTTVISFDNHPDWDIRPPKWGCGSWVNRALELAHIEKVSVWGCGNFECWWPARITGNNRAEREGRLEVHPWADDRSPQEQHRRGAILRDNWREKFATFSDRLGKAEVYVTIDLDCLCAEEAMTNWEAGRFTVDDIVWALGLLRAKTRVVAGDICGAWSQPRYARWKQRFASQMDHPRLPEPSVEAAKRTNLRTLRRLLPCLIDFAAARYHV
jgi:arginase family enzyme